MDKWLTQLRYRLIARVGQLNICHCTAGLLINNSRMKGNSRKLMICRMLICFMIGLLVLVCVVLHTTSISHFMTCSSRFINSVEPEFFLLRISLYFCVIVAAYYLGHFLVWV